MVSCWPTSAQNGIAPLTNGSAASYAPDIAAAESIVSGFADHLADATAVASAPLPVSLGGLQIRILDSAQQSHLAPLYSVSPSQVNYVIPAGVAPGPATVIARRGDTDVARGTIRIAAVAPGVFTAAQTGAGLAAARALLVSSAGTITANATYECNPRCLPFPARTGSASDQLLLELYGTGIRGRSSLSNVTVHIAGVPVEVLYAGPQSQYPGLDQVNVRVPASLLNAGLVQAQLTVEGVPANPVAIQLGGTSPPQAVTARFDPGTPDTGPYPSDALTVPDTSQRTGLRVNLPLPDCASQRTDCDTYRLLNELDGFSTEPRIAVRFSGPVDGSTLRDGIHLVWLENSTNEGRGLQPAGHLTAIDRVLIDPLTNTAYAKPAEALDQHRRFALVVTEKVTDAIGNPVVPDPAFVSCVTAPATDYCRQLAAAQPALGKVPGRVIAASLFTTMSATAWEERARDVVEKTPVHLKRVANVRLNSYVAATLKLQTRANPPASENFTVPLPGIVAAGADRVFFGSFTSPNFLNTRQIISSVPTNFPVQANSTSELAFHAFVPGGDKPASGHPVILFGHGLGDSSFGAPTLAAGAFARSGFVTIVINAVGHGAGPQTQLVLTNFLGQGTTIPVPGRGVDLNNDGVIGSREGCLLPESGIIVRDCLRQTALDWMQMVHAIRDGIDLDGDGVSDLDANRIYYAGQSLGALYGALFLAVEPAVRAGALNAGGGSVVDVAASSDQFHALAREILAMHSPHILNLGTDFDANIPMRGQPPRINTVPSAIEVRNYLDLLAWLQAEGDPLSYAPHLKLSPLSGVPEKRTLFQIARGDRTVPNPASANLIRQAGGQGATVLYRHDIARAYSTGLAENPHAFLVDFRSAPGLAVAHAAQEQIAGYLGSDGMSIPDANSTALDVLFEGNHVFERPASPPEDLGFP